MNVSASEASGIINTLAAASQQGAADIAYLNTAFEKTGTQAKSAGMSYSDLAAAVETVAPKFSSAEIAGSKLQATLLALSV
jgi:TP901 family phage tail tape measure protein